MLSNIKYFIITEHIITLETIIVLLFSIITREIFANTSKIDEEIIELRTIFSKQTNHMLAYAHVILKIGCPLLFFSTQGADTLPVFSSIEGMPLTEVY